MKQTDDEMEISVLIKWTTANQDLLTHAKRTFKVDIGLQ